MGSESTLKPVPVGALWIELLFEAKLLPDLFGAWNPIGDCVEGTKNEVLESQSYP